MYVGEESATIRSSIDWNDTLLIIGHWNTKPNWKQMRQAFCKSLWYNKPNWARTLKITELLNSQNE